MLLSLLLALAQQVRAESRDDVQALVRVPAGVLTLDDVRDLELDVASVLRTGEVDVIADGSERSAMSRAGIPFQVVHPDLAAFYASRLAGDQAMLGTPPLGAWLSPQFGAGAIGGYYSFAQIESVLDQIHAAYPTLTSAKFSLGTTLQGRTLWAMKVSDNVGVDESEPEVRFDSMHHAREPQSMQSTIWLMLALLERYGSDPLSTYLVNAREIWFVPCVNPDGYVHNQTTNPGGGGLWRKNRRANAGGTIGVDLNRNYSHQWGIDNEGSSGSGSSETYRGTAPASEPEIQAMQAFMQSRNFATAISAHTYSDLWLWPWGYTDAGGPANNAQYVELGDLCTLETDWTRGPAGSTLYLANGVTNDYEQAQKGTMSFTPEIGGESDGFWPPTSRIVPLAQTTEPGFLRTAWAAGAYVHDTARATSEVGDSDGFYEAGESFRLVFTLRNSGRQPAAGVEVELACSTPGVTVTTGTVLIGAMASFSSASHAGTPLELALGAGMSSGTRVDYVARIEYEGFVQEFPGSFSLGQPRLVLTDDLETNLGWTVGAPGDAATFGVWAYGNPVGTNSGGSPCNPENDATPAPGVNCFATGNGSTSVGTDDVDGGPTTLVSPRLDLSGLASASLSYQRWFAQFTTVNDELEVSISDDDGASWVELESVTGSGQNAWNTASFDVAEHVELTDRVRLRFRTGDQPNDSLTEAAVDALSVESFDPGIRLNFYGRPTLGADIVMHVAAPPGQPWRVLGSAALPPHLSGGLGALRIWSFRLPSGVSPANGLARLSFEVPDVPALAGATFRARAFLIGTGEGSNVATITFE